MSGRGEHLEAVGRQREVQRRGGPARTIDQLALHPACLDDVRVSGKAEKAGLAGLHHQAAGWIHSVGRWNPGQGTASARAFRWARPRERRPAGASKARRDMVMEMYCPGRHCPGWASVRRTPLCSGNPDGAAHAPPNPGSSSLSWPDSPPRAAFEQPGHGPLPDAPPRRRPHHLGRRRGLAGRADRAHPARALRRQRRPSAPSPPIPRTPTATGSPTAPSTSSTAPPSRSRTSATPRSTWSAACRSRIRSRARAAPASRTTVPR